MGFLSKVFKPIKKVFKKIGKGIKSAFKKFGKFMGKLGPLGTIAMGMILPGIGGMLGQAWSGMAGTLAGSSNALLSGVGNFMTKAASMGSAVSGTVSNITGAVTDVLKETFRAVGNKVGLGNIGPQGMKDFFAKSDGSLMGDKGLFTNVEKSFGKRWEDMSARWGNLKENLGKSTLEYQADLKTGTYSPYKDYDQYKTGLRDKIYEPTRQITENVTGNLKGYIEKEKAMYLDNVDLETESGKFLKDTYEAYEKDLLSKSTSEQAALWTGGEGRFNQYLEKLDPSQPYMRDAQLQLHAIHPGKIKYKYNPNLGYTESVAPPPKTLSGTLRDNLTNTETLGQNLQSSLINTGLSTGVSLMTGQDYDTSGGMGQLGSFYTAPIQSAIPVNTIEGYLNSPVQPQSFGLNEAYGWQTDIGQGIYGNKIRGLAPASGGFQFASNTGNINYQNDQTIQL